MNAERYSSRNRFAIFVTVEKLKNIRSCMYLVYVPKNIIILFVRFKRKFVVFVGELPSSKIEQEEWVSRGYSGTYSLYIERCYVQLLQKIKVMSID
jgi:hypothetical protein